MMALSPWSTKKRSKGEIMGREATPFVARRQSIPSTLASCGRGLSRFSPLGMVLENHHILSSRRHTRIRKSSKLFAEDYKGV